MKVDLSREFDDFASIDFDGDADRREYVLNRVGVACQGVVHDCLKWLADSNLNTGLQGIPQRDVEGFLTLALINDLVGIQASMAATRMYAAYIRNRSDIGG